MITSDTIPTQYDSIIKLKGASIKKQVVTKQILFSSSHCIQITPRLISKTSSIMSNLLYNSCSSLDSNIELATLICCHTLEMIPLELATPIPEHNVMFIQSRGVVSHQTISASETTRKEQPFKQSATITQAKCDVEVSNNISSRSAVKRNNTTMISDLPYITEEKLLKQSDVISITDNNTVESSETNSSIFEDINDMHERRKLPIKLQYKFVYKKMLQAHK